MDAYRSLERRFSRVAAFENALGILAWDQETMMPLGGGDARTEALATLSVAQHDLLTDPAVADWLDAAEDGSAELDVWQRANLREMRRHWVHESAVPADLVEAASEAESQGLLAWRTARRDDDFASLRPLLERILGLRREVGQAKAARLDLSPYDALLDAYEPGARSAAIDALFDDLAAFLPDFTEAVLVRQAAGPPVQPPAGPFPVDAQRALAERLMGAIGFDFERGRLDVSHHPFCGGGDDDVRITTRYDEADFTTSLMAVLHETGHALYEQGRPRAYLRQPVGAARGMAVHESQSLLVEMQACRSREFLAFAAPLIREAFGRDEPALEGDALYGLYTRVQRGLIRVDADEVTYPAHVILRYRLERALLDGDLPLAELPAAWNSLMAELVGVTPPNDTLGCLQDIHWPGGAWAYFPTYTLGAMTAAQLFDAARRQDADIVPGLRRGDFAPLVGWLRGNVHANGSLLTTDELLSRATGRSLDATAFKAHLRARYLPD